ncbi:hypothetical protein BDP81DRAFT_87629 [Colletotrichum phormii]|uniref:Uncharacterized protein n=1 Tax=Colletotrichum phormii TaxID=359342 RepID=A0AAJ0A1G8_9PEZI|nr:uncharacterized protein BDP81DRAFT_87629 [Colletotrichum phormii]KAK1654714.1 hypothetical protein BDP81DRAFT_87629 [Colletotrichum phormii]
MQAFRYLPTASLLTLLHTYLTYRRFSFHVPSLLSHCYFIPQKTRAHTSSRHGQIIQTYPRSHCPREAKIPYLATSGKREREAAAAACPLRFARYPMNFEDILVPSLSTLPSSQTCRGPLTNILTPIFGARISFSLPPVQEEGGGWSRAEMTLRGSNFNLIFVCDYTYRKALHPSRHGA